MRKLICIGIAAAALTTGCFGSGAPSCSDGDVKALVLKILGGGEGISLGNIRTNSTNKEAKKSVCEGDMIYSNGYKMSIVYIAQRTEDGKIYAEGSYRYAIDLTKTLVRSSRGMIGLSRNALSWL